MCHIALCRGPDFWMGFHKMVDYGPHKNSVHVPAASAFPQLELEIIALVGLINPVFVKNSFKRAKF